MRSLRCGRREATARSFLECASIRVATGLIVAGLAATPALPSAARGQIPDTFTNLQHFPDDVPRDSLLADMRDFSFALGVRCTYCHEGEDSMRFTDVDFASDARTTKRRARYMLRMVDRINRELLPDLPATEPEAGEGSGVDVRVECATCHRGYPRPVMIEDSLRLVVQRAGPRDAVRTYRELWDRYYGDWTFDFGVWALNDLTRTLADGGDLDAAVALQRVNVEKHPESTSALFPLAELLRRRGDEGDRQAAVETYRRILSLNPDHRGARRGLDSLEASHRP